MDVESDKVAVLRTVEKVPVSGPRKGHDTGIIFEYVEKTNCPHCKAVVQLGDALPLSWMQCPECQGKVLVPGLVDGFLLHDHIGEGEMGTIYRATDESLQREVAVKVVRGCHIDDPKSRERLRREACSAGRLNHPRVAQVYALNFSNKHPYLVMELVTGLDFLQKIEAEGTIDEPTALRMALDVADGLSALNREHLAHGDIKPGNIVLDRDGNAKLVDFGLSGITRFEDGALVGTPNYIAPELLRGSPDTHRSDIYSLGSTLYHLLSGRLPFEGETSVDILKARLSSEPVPIGTYAPHLSLLTQSLVMRMIDSDPEKRPVNTDVVASDIKEALAQLETLPAESPEVQDVAAALETLPAEPPEVQDVAAPLETLPAEPPEVQDVAAPLEARPAVSPAIKKDDGHDFIAPRHSGSEHPQLISSRRPVVVPLLLCLIAVIELFVAIKQQSFYQTWEWMRRDLAGPVKALVAMVYQQSEPVEPVETDLTIGANIDWESTNLGGTQQRGSTIQSGDVIALQGSGADMWNGADDCRFVSTKASENYEFSVQVQKIADEKDFDITGILVKGDNPAIGPGVLFGFLGSRKLFLQARHLDISAQVVKCSEPLQQLPGYLKLIRQGNLFEALTSVDGHHWDSFAEFELELPQVNTIGLAVSAQYPDVIASARFSDIHLKPLEISNAAQTNVAPAQLTEVPVL